MVLDYDYRERPQEIILLIGVVSVGSYMRRVLTLKTIMHQYLWNLLNLWGPRFLIGGILRNIWGYQNVLVFDDEEDSDKDSESKIYITLDDCPADADLMEELLNLLQINDVKVTFFIIEKWARKQMNLMKKIVNDGHLICNHFESDVGSWLGVVSWDWLTCGCSSNYDEIKLGIHACKSLIEELDEFNTHRFFRPPAGLLTPGITQMLENEFQYQSVLGDVYSNDPAINNAEYHINFAKQNTKPGSIMIYHCPEKARNREQTLDILREMIPFWKKNGYTFCTLDELNMPIGTPKPKDL